MTAIDGIIQQITDPVLGERVWPKIEGFFNRKKVLAASVEQNSETTFRVRGQ